MKLQEFDTHNYLLFQPVDRCFKNNSNHISAGKSKGLSDESKAKNHTIIKIILLWWVLFKTRKSDIYTWKSGEYLDCF